MSLFSYLYILVQVVVAWLFKAKPPPKNIKSGRPRGRIAVIGAGLTGISSAAHAVSHGFEVVIFEAHENVGGIWRHVNSTSSLQLNSFLYRFHPAVIWSCGFPRRDEIIYQVESIWKEYGLEEHTRFNTPVTSVRQATKEELSSANGTSTPDNHHTRWIINDGKDGIFDAVIVCVGTCGKPMWVEFEGMPAGLVESKRKEATNGKDHSPPPSPYPPPPYPPRSKDGNVFKGPIFHSSELDSLAEKTIQGKTLIVVGSGASGVEAVETALHRGAAKCIMLARDDKWIIPRNSVIDTLIATQPFGREMPLSFLWESFLRHVHYHGVEELTPSHLGLFEGTPVVNDVFLPYVRQGKCQYIRGDTKRFTQNGVLVNVRSRDSKPGDEGKEEEFFGDAIVLATGFERPKLDFFSKAETERLFPSRYEMPNLYLQTFSTEDWTVLLTNSAYTNAIGTVGHFHIGIYTRILLTFLMDPATRPRAGDMKLWVDAIRWLKEYTSGSNVGFTFFTYMELTIWFLGFHLLRVKRLRWIFFIMQGWGVGPRVDA